MIIRVVRMHFREEEVLAFRHFFEERKDRIKGQPGCLHLELWQDTTCAEVFFTYSHWNQEADLEVYRNSEFFKETWGLTKALFAAKASAWTVQRV